MLGFLRDYRTVPPVVMKVIAAEFFIQLVNASFMNLQPLYMKSEGFHDAEIADIISWRFAGVLLLAIPLGYYIKGKPVRKLFYASSIGVPLFALLIIACTHFRMHYALIAVQFLWGASFTFMQIPILPFILRNTPAEHQTPTIALSYSTWSLAGISSAVLVWALNSFDPRIFSERNLLVGISFAAFAGLLLLRRVKHEALHNETMEKVTNADGKHDWNLIAKALLPALIIATGAGLTIPFINLFFARVHHLSTDVISLWNFAAALLVAVAALFVPRIKERIGYKLAIPLTQSFAVLSLVLLATTEWYTHLHAAVAIAVGCYLLRQPLMNLAGPMTSEISMKYVGKRNQEMTSALISAIWSGSWFISTRFIFGVLRETGWPYVSIFLITAALYALGIALYVALIASFNRRVRAGEIEE
jgi:predicted MFS family arabinose efflux permease